MEYRIGDINIVRGEVGYIVSEKAGNGVPGRRWAFESAEHLTQFVEGWADNNTDVIGT